MWTRRLRRAFCLRTWNSGEIGTRLRLRVAYSYRSSPRCTVFSRNLPWLNGRGYNTWGVYINNVVCTRYVTPFLIFYNYNYLTEFNAIFSVTPSITASYMALLFESFTDPITTGREELGFWCVLCSCFKFDRFANNSQIAKCGRKCLMEQLLTENGFRPPAGLAKSSCASQFLI